MADLNIELLNEKFETFSSEEILQWTWETFGSTVATSSSFQAQSVPLLHLISLVCPEMPVMFLDTGFHFPETLTYRDELCSRYNLNIINVYPSISQSEQLYQYGEVLYRQDPDLCCHINKVEPMQRAITGYEGWVSGVRRDQTKHRAGLRIIEQQSNGLIRVHPMLRWTKKDVWTYIDQHQLPSHPLFEQGYFSIGCAPCTRPTVSLDGDEREGRWGGTIKTECGLHMDIKT